MKKVVLTCMALSFLVMVMVIGQITALADDYPKMELSFAVVEKDPAATDDFNVDGRAAQMFVDLVAEKSGGNIKIVPYYGGVLGADSAGVVLDEQADLGFFSVTSKYAKYASCFNLPRMMTSFDMAWDLMGPGGEMYELYRKECWDAGLALLGGSAGTFRQVYNTKREVHLPEDMKGMNIRVYADDTVQTFWGSLCNLVTMPMSEVYTGLQMGTIDAMEFPATNFLGFSLQEVTKYATIVNWQWMFNPFIYMTTEAYEEMDPAVIALLEECAAEAMKFHYEEQKNQMEAAIAQIEASGVTVTRLTAEEGAIWDAAAEECYKVIGDKVGGKAPELIAQIKGICDNYKANH